MKADPSAAALLDIFLEGFDGRRLPGVGRIVQLNEELVLRKECVVDLVGVFDVVDGEAVESCLFGEPDFGGIDKGLVNSAGFGDGNDAELRCLAKGERREQKHGDGAMEQRG